MSFLNLIKGTLGQGLTQKTRYKISALNLAGLIVLILLMQPGLGIFFENSGTVSAASDPVIAAAGDIACDPSNSNFNGGLGTSNSCRQKYTSDLLVNSGLSAVLDLGDNQYYCGGYQAFLQSYDLSWGRVKSITHPSVGNHEYLTSGGTDCNANNAGAAGYFEYFGAAAGEPGKGYYSFDIGSWHIIALNSNCGDAGGCGSSSPQGIWLEADLSAHSNFCTLAFWHIPLFSSGGRASSNSQSFWNTLYKHNADLILAGHDHIYERFAPQTPGGVVDTARGIRQFIIGTGGANHTSLATTAANSQLRSTGTFGVLKLTLHPTSYDWQFVPEAGKSFSDSGTGACHGATADTTPPSAPTNLAATQIAYNQVSLGWTASTDNVAVTGYKVFRNGSQIGTANGTSFVDSTVQAQTSYSYTVTAFDGANLNSGPSNTVNLTTPATPPTITFGPTDDTYVQSDTPGGNFGASTQTVVDNSPVRNLLLKFTVSGVGTKQVVSAKLRLYCVDGSGYGGDFHRVGSTSWNEGSVTWNTAPASDAATLGVLGAVTANTWYEVDVTSLISGDGTFSLKGFSSSSDGAYYSTKEGTAGFAPQLVVVTSSTSTTPATPTPTPALTATPTSTGTPPSSLLFSDGFESGNLLNWNLNQGITVQNQEVANGSFAARGTSTAATTLGTYARKSLAAPQTEIYYRILFKVISQGANTVNLLKLRSATDAPILSLSINDQGRLSYRNDVAGTSVNSTVTVAPGAWQSLQVHLRIADTASQVEVWYNNTLVGGLSRTDSFGTNPIGRVQLGENTGGLSYDIAFDDVSVATGVIAGDPPPSPTPTNTPVPATATPTSTATAAFTNTPVPATATPAFTATATYTNTPVPATATPAFTATATFTNTPVPATATPTATATPAPTNTPTATRTPTSTATPTIAPAKVLTFNSSADAYIQSNQPNSNFGSAAQLIADSAPTKNLLLKFSVSGIGTDKVVSAKLRLFCVDGSPSGGEFHRVAESGWSESTVTWRTAPAADSSILGSLSNVASGTWVELDVTSLVTGDGTFSLRAGSPSNDSAAYSSREGANQPQLVIGTIP